MSVLLRVKRAYDGIPNFVKLGLPFFIFVVGASFGLKEFAHLRYQFRRGKFLKPEELKEMGLTMKDPSEISLESVYEEVKDIDTDNWENIRGPRPEEPDIEEVIDAMKQKAAARRKQEEEARVNRIRNS